MEKVVFRSIDYLWCFLFLVIIVYIVFKKKIIEMMNSFTSEHWNKKEKMNNWETISENN